MVVDLSATQVTFSCPLASNILFRLYMGKTPGWWLTPLPQLKSQTSLLSFTWVYQSHDFSLS